jgi:plastocyanin domain-containing protein
MLRGVRIAVALIVIAFAAGCEKKAADKPAPAKTAPVTAGNVGTDGVRRIDVVADNKGYTPSEITAKPNEKLVLVVTRKVDGECLSKLRVGDKPPVELPLNAPIDIAVTAPASGKLEFACGMDMYFGSVVVGGS